jgi:hypothetical protein
MDLNSRPTLSKALRCVSLRGWKKAYARSEHDNLRFNDSSEAFNNCDQRRAI